MSFDPACEHLLDKPLDNLFEGVEGDLFRCKGCGKEMAKRERSQHKARHVAGRTRSRNAAERRRQAELEAQLERARTMRKRMAES